MAHKEFQRVATESETHQLLNYFSYNSEIEDVFIRRRGKHLHLCPLDWAMMEVWKERGIPLHVVLRGIERWFDLYESRRPKRPVNTLLYCEEEVEAQYAEWLESRVGSHQQAVRPQPEIEEDQRSTFSRDVVLAHLARARAALEELSQKRERSDGDQLSEALSRATTLLAEIENDYATAARPDARRLEDSLTGLERLLNGALRATASTERLEEMRKEVKRQLRPYRSHMDRAVYEQTAENLLLKSLREQFGVPRLSLFYL